MKAIPVAMRERILKLYDQGKSTAEIAAFSGYCVAAVRRVRQQFKSRGTVEPQTHLCGRKTLLTAQRKTRLQKLVADQPDATLAELGTRLVFVDESGANTKMTRLGGRAPVGERLVSHIPHGHYQTSTLIAAVRLEGACAPWLFDGAMDGELFLAWVQQGLAPTLQPADLVIMDNLATHKVAGVREAIESVGARLRYREFGRAPKGERIYEAVAGKRRERTSIILAAQQAKLVAPLVFQGSCNTGVVDVYCEQVLLPELPVGSVIVLDNARFHQSPTTQRLVEDAGYQLLFLPAYSPDLNPIEHLRAAFKTRLRKDLATATNPFLFIANMSQCYC